MSFVTVFSPLFLSVQKTNFPHDRGIMNTTIHSPLTILLVALLLFMSPISISARDSKTQEKTTRSPTSPTINSQKTPVSPTGKTPRTPVSPKFKTEKGRITLPRMKLKGEGGRVYLLLSENVRSLNAYLGNRHLGKLGSGKRFPVDRWFTKANGKSLTFGFDRLRSREFTQKEYLTLAPKRKLAKDTGKVSRKTPGASARTGVPVHPAKVVTNLKVKEIRQKKDDIFVILENKGSVPANDYHKARITLTYAGKKHSWPLRKVASLGELNSSQSKRQIVFKTGLKPNMRGQVKARVDGLGGSLSTFRASAMIIPKVVQAQGVSLPSSSSTNKTASNIGQPVMMSPSANTTLLSQKEQMERRIGSVKQLQEPGDVQALIPITAADALRRAIDSEAKPENLSGLDHRQQVTGSHTNQLPSEIYGPNDDGDDGEPKQEVCVDYIPEPPEPEVPLWTGADYSKDIIITQPGIIHLNNDFTVVESSIKKVEGKVKKRINPPPGGALKRIDGRTYTHPNITDGGEIYFNEFNDLHSEEPMPFKVSIIEKTKEQALKKARERNPCASYGDSFWIRLPAKVGLRYCYMLEEDHDVQFDVNGPGEYNYEESWHIDCGEFPWEEELAYVPVKVIFHNN